MNAALHILYSTYWDNYLQQILIPNLDSTHDCAYPYLIHASDQYQNAAKRVMICGQESFGWGRKDFPNYDEVTPATLQQMYHGFICHPEKSANNVNKPGRRSPYWNFSWKLMQAHPEYGFIFQNVVKIGRKVDKGCDDVLLEEGLKYFPVWKEELKILKPDVIIFLTGDYDWRIRKVIGSFQTNSIAPKLDQLIFEDSSMPLCYRTNHPQNLLFTKNYYPMLGHLNNLLSNIF